MLEFIVLIIYPDKLTRVTITIGNTIFGALDGGCPIDLGVSIPGISPEDSILGRQAKLTPICPSLFHLYYSRDNLTELEEIDYEVAQELLSYRIISDAEPQSNPIREGVEEGTKDQG